MDFKKRMKARSTVGASWKKERNCIGFLFQKIINLGKDPAYERNQTATQHTKIQRHPLQVMREAPELIREIGTEKQLVGAISVGYPAEAPLSRPRKPIEDILEYHA